MRASSILLIGLLVFWALIFSWDYSSASPEKVSAMIQKADKSPDAKAEVSAFLKVNPNPTNNDVSAINGKIDEFLVRDLARGQTGDATIQTKSQIEDAQDKKNQEAINKELSRPLLAIGKYTVTINSLIMFLIPLFVVMFGFSFMMRRVV